MRANGKCIFCREFFTYHSTWKGMPISQACKSCLDLVKLVDINYKLFYKYDDNRVGYNKCCCLKCNKPMEPEENLCFDCSWDLIQTGKNKRTFVNLIKLEQI